MTFAVGELKPESRSQIGDKESWMWTDVLAGRDEVTALPPQQPLPSGLVPQSG